MAAAHLYHLPAKIIIAVRLARRAHRVADNHRAILAQDAEGNPQDGGVDVETVADQLRADSRRIHHSPNHAGRAVRQAAHGVVQMGRVRNTPGKGLLRLLEIRFRVRDGDGAELLCPLHKRLRSLTLGRDIHQAHNAAAILIQRAEQLPVGIADVFFLLRSLFLRGDERPFHVDAEDARALLRTLHAAARGAQSGADLLGRHRHGGGTEGGNALGHEMTRHFADRLLLAVTGIRTDTAVNVHVHKARRHNASGAVKRFLSRQTCADFPDPVAFRAQIHLHQIEILIDQPSIFQNHDSFSLSFSSGRFPCRMVPARAAPYHFFRAPTIGQRSHLSHRALI